MQVFLAIPLTSSSAKLNSSVESRIAAADRYKLAADRGWLIRFSGTTMELSNTIGLTGQAPGDTNHSGPAIVAPITGYFGRGSTEMWEWLKTRFEQ